MSQKKVITKGTRKGAAARATSAATNNSGDLAEMLSATMNHPDIPNELYNVIGEWLNDTFHDGLNISEPWVIRRALDRTAREGGAS
jgi:hypothetical protein